MGAGTSMLIEDVACPVEKLGDMTLDLIDMFERYGYKDASCFGHALEGNLHLVFSQVWFPTLAMPLLAAASDECCLHSIPCFCIDMQLLDIAA